MPLYDYECGTCGATGNYLASVANHADSPLCESCGNGTSQVILSAPGAIVRFPAAGGHAYVSPASGKYIDTQAKRRDDLARTGCRPYEGFAAEKKEADRLAAAAEKKRDEKLHDNVSRAYYSLSPEKRKVLNAG